VGDLSGGERRRLQLLRLLMAEPNVLLLDEPTNDLDVDTLTALEDLLDSFAGTVLVVSHDRYFVDRVCDSVVALMGDGSLAALPGGVEEYLARRAAGEAQLRPAGRVEGAGPAAPALADGPSAGEVRAARKEAARLERRLEKLSADEEKLHAQLAAAATDHAKVLELDARLRELLAEKDRVESDWLAAAEVAEG
jgi:ATP-binding cassette subfamily F protein uup